MNRSRIIDTGDQMALRLRVLPGPAADPVAELTQLHRRPDGFDAEQARVFLPLTEIDAFVSALLATRAEALNEEARSKGEGRLRRAAEASRARASSHAAHQGDF